MYIRNITKTSSSIKTLNTNIQGFHFTTTVDTSPYDGSTYVTVFNLYTTNICNATSYNWYIVDNNGSDILIATGNNPTFHSDEYPSVLVNLPYRIKLEFTLNDELNTISSPLYTGDADDLIYQY
jgi:hypothetical protein